MPDLRSGFAPPRLVRSDELGRAGPSTSPPPEPGFRHYVRLLKDLGMILGALAVVGTAVGGGVSWYQTRASKQELGQVKVECDAAVAAAIVPLLAHLKLLDDLEKKNGKRWDRLDSFHSQVRSLNLPNKTAPPKFGPTAEKRGEIPKNEMEVE